MTEALQYLLITVQEVALEKVCFRDTQNPKALTVNENHYLLTRNNLTETIQIQLSQKQKTFCQFFFCIFKIYIIF